MSKTSNEYATTKDGYVTPNAKLFWNPGNPNLHWGFEGLAGMNGKRYLYYPPMNFYTNDDGTVRAFGQDSLPVTNVRGKNYIELMVPGKDSTATWYTGHGMYTVKNHLRIPVGETKPYIPPPPAPEPTVTDSISTKIPEPEPAPQPDPKPIVKPDTIVRQKPVPIPPDKREGLVKVVDGKPYYELPGDPKEIEEIIESIIGGGGIEEGESVVYEDVPPSPPTPSDDEKEQTGSQQNISAIPPIKKQQSTNRETEGVPADPDNEGVYMYKYPHRNVHIYQISPELAHLVRQQIGNSSDRVYYKYSNVQLRNLPNGELNDTTYHDIFRIHPSESDWIKFQDGNDVAHSRLTQTAEASIGRGYHTDADKVVLMNEPWYTTYGFGVQKQTSLEIDPNTGLYFVRWPKRMGDDTGKRIQHVIHTKGHNYYPSGDMIKDANGNLHEVYDDMIYGGNKTMLTSAPLSTHMTTYPWREVVKQQQELQQNDSNIIKRGVDTIKELFGIKKFGGKINYLNYFK